jgi:Zn-dependent protease with chaperone function
MGAGAAYNGPTGLYGWIRSNDARSLKLFAGFALAVQLLAAGILLLPLALFDPAHSPLFGLDGYLVRYVPIIFLLSVIVFAAQLFWYMQTVKNASGFVFVDDQDEPRLCRIIEPLIVLQGMPAPFVAVIETSQRNAFACGISRKRAVVVVTRGLLEALNDDELEAVLAHELAHVRNGDIRLMAAANICMRNMREFKKVDEYKFNLFAAVASVAIPALFPLIVLGCLVAQVGMRWAFASRLAITSSREFIADAQAAQLTKNPAALASALIKVDGQHRIDEMRREDDAMMIAGESEGKDASHPDVRERIDALARVTGSMVFNAPGAASPEALGGVERQAVFKGKRSAGVLARARQAVPGGLLGFSRKSHYMMLATIAAFLLINLPDIGSARAMAAKFDVRTIGVAFGISKVSCPGGADQKACLEDQQELHRTLKDQRGTLAGFMAGRSLAAAEGRSEEGALISPAVTAPRPYTGVSGKLTGVTAAMDSRGLFAEGMGTYTSRPPESLTIAEVVQVGCFPARLLYDNPEGQFPLDRATSGGFSIKRATVNAEGSLITYGDPGTPQWREWLLGYAERRESLLRSVYDNFGLAGLRMIAGAYDTPAHHDVLDDLRENAKDPSFMNGLDELAQAKLEALVRDPAGFVPCQAVRHGYGEQ